VLNNDCFYIFDKKTTLIWNKQVTKMHVFGRFYSDINLEMISKTIDDVNKMNH